MEGNKKKRKEREKSGCPTNATRSYFIIDTQTTKAWLRDLSRVRRLLRIEASGISMRAAPFCIVILQCARSIIGFFSSFSFLHPFPRQTMVRREKRPENTISKGRFNVFWKECIFVFLFKARTTVFLARRRWIPLISFF